ncbi:HAMP domain-containing sensor histidine kinase [Oscillospiraceae bacterium LTW-04]|nr:HAMP domain-containing sensor histidine kinase [Oscillospiraceae bacterium MB24-C1]
MKIKANITLWGSFVISVFLIMSFSAFVTTGAFVMMNKRGWITMARPNPFVPLISFLFTAVMVGTMVSVLVGHKITQPIKRLSEALKEIARGNFNVRMSTAKWLPEGREMMRNFNVMAQELSSIETLRNDFVVNVSHEFKTPIAAIEGYATLLQNVSLTDADREEYSRLIIESTQKLSMLTSNILRLSKLENQEIVPSKLHFSLDEQLRQALLLLEGQWAKKAIELDIELMPVVFYGSEELLQQVWLNILGNAIKFTPHYGTVSVRLFERAEQVTVTVSDTGIGISPEIHPHIFEKFYQGDHTRAVEGNGLGLALAKRIVTLCGGDILVRSDIGEGACFTVTLPNHKQ